jgi:hypothetical protein
MRLGWLVGKVNGRVTEQLQSGPNLCRTHALAALEQTPAT